MAWSMGLLGATAVPVGAFDLLETTLISADTASVTFSSLGSYSDYKHLQIRTILAGSSTSTAQLYIRFNGISSTSYARHFMRGDGTAVGVSAAINQTQIAFNFIGSSSATSAFSAGVIDILDYSSTSKNTTIRSLEGQVNSLENFVRLESGLFNSTAAITSITMSPSLGNFIAGSRFSLYGVK